MFELKSKLNENQEELLTYFNKLPERQQVKWIARIGDVAAEYDKQELPEQEAK